MASIDGRCEPPTTNDSMVQVKVDKGAENDEAVEQESMQKSTIQEQQVSLALPVNDGEMMAKFEAISQLFKSEVECLVGRQQATASQDMSEMKAQLSENRAALAAEQNNAEKAVQAVRSFAQKRYPDHGTAVLELANDDSNTDILRVVQAFLDVTASSPEIELVKQERSDLVAELHASRCTIAELEQALKEARTLKSEEERELAEFKALREKESELQAQALETQRLRAQVAEFKVEHQALEAKKCRQDSLVQEKSAKVLDLLKKLEAQSEQVRLLSDENNNLRLELGRDSEFKFEVASHSLVYECKAGALCPELQTEESRFQADVIDLTKHFGELYLKGTRHDWCSLQLQRAVSTYRSFLHRLEDYRCSFASGVTFDFVSRACNMDMAWSQNNEDLKASDAEFQKFESKQEKKWELHRLQLVSERDTKTKQLLDQAERSQGKAQKQLLLHQAKLFGQRIDAQIERAWQEQRQEREQRWREQQETKKTLRQRLKDETSALQERCDSATAAGARFRDVVQQRLTIAEEAWERSIEVEAGVSSAVLRRDSFREAMRSLVDAESVPSGQAQHSIGSASECLEQWLRSRVGRRGELRETLEAQTLQQLKPCIEAHVQREAQKKQESDSGYPQADVMLSLLQMRQHRHLADTLKRQHYDFLVLLRLCTLAAVSLLPESAQETCIAAHQAGVLPALPIELMLNAKSEAGLCPDAVDTQEGDEAEAAHLHGSLCQRLLLRNLSTLQSLHAEELVDLKRRYTREQRRAAQRYCQLEPQCVRRVVAVELQETASLLRTRLLGDHEAELGDERRRLAAQVASEVSRELAAHARRVEAEGAAAASERSRWLCERLVLLRSQGTLSHAERLIAERLQAELAACDRASSTQAPPSSPAATGPSGPSPSPQVEREQPSKPPRAKPSHLTQPAATGQAPCSAEEVQLSARPPLPPLPPSPRLPHFGRGPSPDFGTAKDDSESPLGTPFPSKRPPSPARSRLAPLEALGRRHRSQEQRRDAPEAGARGASLDSLRDELGRAAPELKSARSRVPPLPPVTPRASPRRS